MNITGIGIIRNERGIMMWVYNISSTDLREHLWYTESTWGDVIKKIKR